MISREGRLLIRLWIRRLANRITARRSTAGRKGTVVRRGTAARKGSAALPLLSLLVIVAMPFLQKGILGDISQLLERRESAARVTPASRAETGLERPNRALGHERGPRGDDPDDMAPLTVPLEDATRELFAFLLLLVFLGVTLTEISTHELEGHQGDLEWLATFPIPLPQLLRARLFASAVVSPLGYMWVWSLLTALALNADMGWTAPLAALVAVQPLLLLRATVKTFFETALHLRLAPSGIRNVKAISTVVGTATLFIGFYARRFMVGLADGVVAAAPILSWLPPGLAARLVTTHSGAERVICALFLFLESGLLAWGGLGLTRRLLDRGLFSGGARESVRATAVPVRSATGGGLSPVALRELLLLRRDFNYFTQTLLLPLVFVGFQVLNAQRGLSDLAHSLPTLCAFAFGVSVYTLQFSAMKSLLLEGDALWLLYTFPRRLSAVLREKAKLWGGLVAVYPIAMLALGLPKVRDFELQQLASVAMLLLGVPLFAFIETALGVLTGSTPGDKDRRRLPASIALVSTGLLGIYAGTIAAGSTERCFAVSILMIVFAIALWQRADDMLPYLLDPDAAPPRRVGLVDGVAAVLVFTIVQGLVTFGLMAMKLLDPGSALFVAYAIAGAVSGGAAWLLIEMKGEAERSDRMVPRVAVQSALMTGLGAGLLAGAAGIGYSFLLHRTGLLDPLKELAPPIDERAFPWIAALAVLLAPPCEEYLFRRLVFRGLLRSFGIGRSILLSAFLFAIVHPLVAIPPVFLLGAAAAFVYFRTGRLAAAITAHATYNAVVVGAQLFGH